MSMIARFCKRFLSIALIFNTLIAFGQNPQGTKVSQYTDQQIMQLWQQASEKGLSESDAMKLLVSKGLAAGDVALFKKRLIALQSDKKSQFPKSSMIQDTAVFMRDSTWVLSVPNLKKPSNKYGYEFFSSPNTSFEPNLRLATPVDYVLGPDDQLLISLTGLNETDETVRVNADGNINIQHVGIINVNGLTIEKAKMRIKSKMASSYPALQSKLTNLTISLTQFRTIRVTIIGEAVRPGGYQVSALASVFNVLYLAGGPTENGTLRDIQLVRHHQKIASIDLYEFLQKGTLSNDLRLEDQDVIVFAPYHKRVELGGQVKRPAIYELKNGETLSQALQYAGGFTDSAFTDRLKIVQLTGKEKIYKEVDANSFNNYLPLQGDSIFAEKLIPVFFNKVSISGAVYRPGDYSYSANSTLSSLLKKADGLRSDAFLSRASIKRLSTNRDRVMIAVDLNKVNKGEDIVLQKEDSVIIYAKQDLEETPYVTVEGYVRNPTKIIFRKGMQVQDVIAAAGGFTKEAAYHRIELSRIIPNRTDSLANHLVNTVRLSLDTNLSVTAGDNTYALQAQDYIYVPKLLNSIYIGDVKVYGEVLFPGTYALERRNEDIASVLQKAGGLTKYGALTNLQVYRKGVLIGVNVDDNNSRDLQLSLLPGDSLYISRNDPFVEVVGAVYSPQLTRYESGSFKSYISAAGGLKNRASLAKAYIQYANGINKKSKKFLFLRFYPRVTPGSKIIVPEVPETEKGLTATQLTAITSVLSALVSLAAILKL